MKTFHLIKIKITINIFAKIYRDLDQTFDLWFYNNVFLKSGKLSNAFVFITLFVKNLSPHPLNRRKKQSKLCEFIILKCACETILHSMWDAEGGGHLQYENDSSSHRATYAWKSCFSYSCKIYYSHGVAYFASKIIWIIVANRKATSGKTGEKLSKIARLRSSYFSVNQLASYLSFNIIIQKAKNLL